MGGGAGQSVVRQDPCRGGAQLIISLLRNGARRDGKKYLYHSEQVLNNRSKRANQIDRRSSCECHDGILGNPPALDGEVAEQYG